MPWTTSHHPDLPIIEVVYQGDVTPEELRRCVDESLGRCRSSGSSLILTDCLQLTGGHNVSELYELANLISLDAPPDFTREAVLYAPGGNTEELVLFWENVCQNRAFDVKSFDCRESAIEWLLRD